VIYFNGQLNEYKDGKSQTVNLPAAGNSPGIVFLFSAVLDQTVALAFNHASNIFLKDKNRVAIRLQQQKCNMGKRKVLEGKVYISKGKVDDLLALILQEMPVKVTSE
jgi:hypothetical protein